MKLFQIHSLVLVFQQASSLAGLESFSVQLTAAGVWTTYLTVTNEISERTLNPGTAALTVTFANNADSDADGDGFIRVAVSTMSGGNARGIYYLEMLSTTAAGWVEAA